MSISSLIGSSFNPFFLGLLVFLSCHMTFYVFSYSSLVFAIIVIYSTVFGMVYGEQIEQSCFALQSSFHKNFIAKGFTPFTGSGWNNVEVDEKGNVIDEFDSENDEEEEAEESSHDDDDDMSRTGPKSKKV